MVAPRAWFRVRIGSDTHQQGDHHDEEKVGEKQPAGQGRG